MTLLVGDPGLGKSTIALDIVARVTTGTPWPDGTPGVPAAPVVLLSAEDGAADTIRPRLDAAGAAVEKVELLTGVRDGDRERGFHLADVAVLDVALVQTGARLVVVVSVRRRYGAHRLPPRQRRAQPARSAGRAGRAPRCRRARRDASKQGQR